MRKSWLLFSQAVTVAVAMLFVVATLKPEWLKRGNNVVALPSVVTVATAPVLPAASAAVGVTVMSYAPAARLASPAVVSITASKAPPRNPRNDDPVFRYFFGDRAPSSQAEPQVGLGSGVIVSSEGYLLTNNHVIDGADDIEVMLTDGRQARAKLVGTDPDTDVAVLKIALDKLPAITFGDADHVQVGDVVLAIGNPFGVGQTVTSGIVSALGRNQLGINTFENFIQTDAAINPGNSGGALVDADGRLVGINTAIFSRSGGSLGIGFAIPVDVARQVATSILKDGVVSRGWIGVQTRELTPELAEALKLGEARGVLIGGVVTDAPAAKAGIKPGDVLTRIGEHTVATPAELLASVAALKPQSHVEVAVQRAGKAMNFSLAVGQRPRPQRASEDD